MKIFPILTALLVSAFLYGLVFERDALMAIAQNSGAAMEATDTSDAVQRVSVVAMASAAQTIDSAVIVRGQTEAVRQLTVRSETSGLVINTPLRKGAFVEEGAEMCVLNPGTSQVRLAEALARLAEAKAKYPPVNVSDYVDHIDYIKNKIGIDHVGISSDFDGGGGIEGWQDASETFNVTLELVKRGYTKEEIGKIWSGNLLRVLDATEETAKRLQAN